ncbi:MAG: hypothetical protein R3F50_21560 [Gammaproteobacteria bacterium]
MSNADLKETWVASQVPKTRENIRTYLLLHFPNLGADIDDLAHESIADILSYVDKNSTELPSEWYDPPNSNIGSKSESHFSRLAYLIAKRRAIDFLRSRNRWISNYDVENLESQSSLSNNERHLSASRILIETVKLIESLPKEDQDLLLTTIEARKDDHPYSTLERQRISRLRKKLSKKLQSIFGDSFTQIVKEKYKP